MGDATIPEVSAFVFMPNGPVRAWCKKGLEAEANLNLLSLFNTFFVVTQILSRLIDHFHSLLSISLPLPDTVVLRTNGTSAIYRSKMAFFKRAWQIVKVLSRP